MIFACLSYEDGKSWRQFQGGEKGRLGCTGRAGGSHALVSQHGSAMRWSLIKQVDGVVARSSKCYGGADSYPCS